MVFDLINTSDSQAQFKLDHDFHFDKQATINGKGFPSPSCGEGLLGPFPSDKTLTEDFLFTVLHPWPTFSPRCYS